MVFWPLGQKNWPHEQGGHINKMFFLRLNVWRFLRGGQKSGRNNQVAVFLQNLMQNSLPQQQ